MSVLPSQHPSAVKTAKLHQNLHGSISRYTYAHNKAHADTPSLTPPSPPDSHSLIVHGMVARWSDKGKTILGRGRQ